MSIINQMNNTCVSHLLIPESDQIQIVVSKVLPEKGRLGGTDITVTTMNRSRQGQYSSGSGGSQQRRLPPLVFRAPSNVNSFIGEDPSSRQMLSPGGSSSSETPTRSSRIPSPIRRSSMSTSTASGLAGKDISSNGGGAGFKPVTGGMSSSPTIYGGGGSSLGGGNIIMNPLSSSMPASPTTPTSRYHQGCFLPNSASSPSAFPQQRFNSGSARSANPSSATGSGTGSNFGSNNNPNYFTGTGGLTSNIGLTPRQSSRSRSRSRSPYQRTANNQEFYSAGRAAIEQPDMEPDKVEEFLADNPAFLENYVTRNIDQETLECWLIDRQKVAHSRKSSLSRWKYGSGSEPRRNQLQELARSLQRNNQQGSVMWELALCISSAVSADSFTLYLSNKNDSSLQRYLVINGESSSVNSTSNGRTSSGKDTSAMSSPPSETNMVSFESSTPRTYTMGEGLTMAAYVGQRRSPLRLTRMEAESRFPEGLGENPDSIAAVHILCHPIIRADGDLSGVVELHRNNPACPFYAEDEEVVNSYVVWGGIALHYAELNAVMHKQKKLNDFLLNVVKSIFQDMVSMDTLIKKVMNYAQKLVDADRASLFLLDNKNKELYARLFDMGGGQDLILNPDTSTKEPAKEIRFAVGTGIAGQVAATGQVLNIPDAYADDRFNRAVDQITGYHTKSILCMPVFIRATVIGVVQMVNKRTGSFTKDDEEAFQTFAVYCGLALHHAKLYDKIRRSEQKFKVALEVLSYHNTCNDDEFVRYKAQGVPHTVLGLDDYYFLPMSIDDNLKVHYTLYMFIDLFGLSRFDSDHLYRFVLTVRKNYRRVPYHNWTHGFTVANSMYCILKNSKMFRPLECLALFVGCLCHDLDHRGRSNKFMLDTASPLASIYTTSTMEHHHFNQTVTILQQEGHNIFSKLSSEEYKQALGNIKHCILATDLAMFFPNKARLADLVAREAFSWGLPDHRLLIEAIAMTAADLCASTKPWDAQVETVKVIFEEFYEQGDLEKAAGRIPIPMMDRMKNDEQAASQVGFLSGICMPCYSLLEELIPESRPMLGGVEKNLERWKALAEIQKGNKEAREKREQEEEAMKNPPPAATTLAAVVPNGPESEEASKEPSQNDKSQESINGNSTSVDDDPSSKQPSDPSVPGDSANENDELPPTRVKLK